MTGTVGFDQRDRTHRPENSRAAGHVVLHRVHVLGRLDRDAAGVKRDAFTDKSKQLAFFPVLFAACIGR